VRRAHGRHLEPAARPERLRPAARREPDADHPGARRPLRRRRPARALGLARKEEGPDPADDGEPMTAAPITPGRERVELVSARPVAVVGIVPGVVGAWTALPPLHTRNIPLPLLLGILAIGCGIWAVARDVKR